VGRRTIDAASADRTLGALLKARDDLDRVRREGLDELVEKAARRAGPVEGASDAAA
jgi:hypothetical protein